MTTNKDGKSIYKQTFDVIALPLWAFVFLFAHNYLERYYFGLGFLTMLFGVPMLASYLIGLATGKKG